MPTIYSRGAKMFAFLKYPMYLYRSRIDGSSYPPIKVSQ